MTRYTRKAEAVLVGLVTVVFGLFTFGGFLSSFALLNSPFVSERRHYDLPNLVGLLFGEVLIATYFLRRLDGISKPPRISVPSVIVFNNHVALMALGSMIYLLLFKTTSVLPVSDYSALANASSDGFAVILLLGLVGLSGTISYKEWGKRPLAPSRPRGQTL